MTHPTTATMKPTTVDELLDYWPGNIPFKGSLVNEDGTCMCAQGQVLHFLDGASPRDLRDYQQSKADKRVAELLGISRAHAVLLRIINDGRPGAPSVVIRDPRQVLGDQADTVLKFWWHLDRTSADQWTAARDAAWAAAGAAARDAAEEAAAWATNEIQGASILRTANKPFYFLPMFGLATPEDIK